MNELAVPNIAIGALALAVAVLCAAWHEYTAQNHRDAKLLAVVAAFSLVGGAAAWF